MKPSFSPYKLVTDRTTDCAKGCSCSDFVREKEEKPSDTEKPSDAEKPSDTKKPVDTATNSEGTVVTSGSDTKTTLKDVKGILPETARFQSQKITDTKVVEKVTEVVKDGIQKVEAEAKQVKEVVVYELNLSNGSVELHQLADKVEVSMDMPFEVGENESIQVYRVEGEQLIPCKTTIVNGKVVFETDHFSTYAFVKMQVSATPVKTGDASNVILWMLLALAGIALVTTARKRA